MVRAKVAFALPGKRRSFTPYSQSRNKDGYALKLYRSHWRGSPYDPQPERPLLACFWPVESLSPLPLLAGVPDFRGYEFAAPSALLSVWQSVGSEAVTAITARFHRCPVFAFSPPLPGWSHLTGCTGGREKIPVIDRYYAHTPTTS